MMDKGSLDVNAVEFNTSAVVMNRSMADLNINNGLHETRAGPSPIMVSAHDMGSTGDMGIPGIQHSTSPYTSTPPQVTMGFPANFRPDYSFLKYVASDPGSHARTTLSVTSITFDSREELLWMGNAGGHVTSYYGPDLQKYTSFQVHSDDDIRCQLTGDYGLLSLTKNQLNLKIRRGLTVFNHRSNFLKDMYCMSQMENASLIVMGGQQSQLLEFDLEREKNVRITEMIESEESGCVVIRSDHPKLLCSGDTVGKITLRDKNTMKIQHVFQAHSGQLSDFDVRGNYLVTCGYSKRNNNFNIDRFLMVYDLRMFKAMNPIHMNFSPHLLRFVPIYSNKFCVVSQTGKFQLLDTSGSINPPPFLHTIDIPHGSSITSFDVSKSSQALSFADSSGFIYLFGASHEVVYNVSSQPTEFPDEVQRQPSIPLDATIPTSIPYTSITPQVIPNQFEDPKEFLKSLSSFWPPEMTKKVHRKANTIQPDILESMKMIGTVGYAPNPFRGGNQPKPPLYTQWPVADDTDCGFQIRDDNDSTPDGNQDKQPVDATTVNNPEAESSNDSGKQASGDEGKKEEEFKIVQETSPSANVEGK